MEGGPEQACSYAKQTKHVDHSSYAIESKLGSLMYSLDCWATWRVSFPALVPAYAVGVGMNWIYNCCPVVCQWDSMSSSLFNRDRYSMLDRASIELFASDLYGCYFIVAVFYFYIETAADWSHPACYVTELTFCHIPGGRNVSCIYTALSSAVYFNINQFTFFYSSYIQGSGKQLTRLYCSLFSDISTLALMWSFMLARALLANRVYIFHEALDWGHFCFTTH